MNKFGTAVFSSFLLFFCVFMIYLLVSLFTDDDLGRPLNPRNMQPPPASLSELVVAEPDFSTPYSREDQFGEPWVSTASSKCDMRNQVLARDLTDVRRRSSCLVLSGNLVDPYTGIEQPFTRGPETSGLVQIDHVVSLSNAWRSGAANLSQEERVALANDPLNLRAVNGEVNLAKSDLAADKWLPPLQTAQCDYVQTQINVKHKYELTITAQERDAMSAVLASCSGVS